MVKFLAKIVRRLTRSEFQQSLWVAILDNSFVTTWVDLPTTILSYGATTTVYYFHFNMAQTLCMNLPKKSYQYQLKTLRCIYGKSVECDEQFYTKQLLITMPKNKVLYISQFKLCFAQRPGQRLRRHLSRVQDGKSLHTLFEGSAWFLSVKECS